MKHIISIYLLIAIIAILLTKEILGIESVIAAILVCCLAVPFLCFSTYGIIKRFNFELYLTSKYKK